jgi:hypothetical protein
VPLANDLGQGRHGEIGRAHEDDAKRHGLRSGRGRSARHSAARGLRQRRG